MNVCHVERGKQTIYREKERKRKLGYNEVVLKGFESGKRYE